MADLGKLIDTALLKLFGEKTISPLAKSVSSLAESLSSVLEKIGSVNMTKGDLQTQIDNIPDPYTHPTSSGNKHIPSGGSSGKILRWSSDGTAAWGDDKDTTYSNFVKSGSGAKAGLVPAPSTTAGTSKYLREDGTWQIPPDTNTTYSNFVKSGSGAKAGLVPAPSTTAGTSKYLREDGTWQTPPDTNTTYSNFVKSGSGAKAGLVPAPSTTAGTSKYLREDGTWQTPPDTNTWRGIQNNLTSGSTSESLAAAQGKVLKGLIDEVKSLRATLNAYGLVKVTDSSAVTDSTGLALAATEKNASISGTLANQISQLNTDLLNKWTKAPTANGQTQPNSVNFGYGEVDHKFLLDYVFNDGTTSRYLFNTECVELEYKNLQGVWEKKWSIPVSIAEKKYISLTLGNGVSLKAGGVKMVGDVIKFSICFNVTEYISQGSTIATIPYANHEFSYLLCKSSSDTIKDLYVLNGLIVNEQDLTSGEYLICIGDVALK